MTTKEIGAWGEARAAEFLEEAGYLVLRRNYVCRSGELDLILLDEEDQHVFVEVKTRKNTCFGTPAEAVDARKQQKIRACALTFLQSEEKPMRFDVVEVLYEEAPICTVREIRHIQNAF